MRMNPPTIRNTCSIKHFTRFVAVLIRRDTDEMPLKSSETADGRWQGEENGHPPAGDVCTSLQASGMWIPVACSRNWGTLSGCKPTFDSIYRYRQSHHLSTERLDCLLHSWRQQTGVHRRLRHCWKWHYETESLMTLMSTTGSKGLINSLLQGFLHIVHMH